MAAAAADAAAAAAARARIFDPLLRDPNPPHLPFPWSTSIDLTFKTVQTLHEEQPLEERTAPPQLPGVTIRCPLRCTCELISNQPVNFAQQTLDVAKTLISHDYSGRGTMVPSDWLASPVCPHPCTRCNRTNRFTPLYDIDRDTRQVNWVGLFCTRQLSRLHDDQLIQYLRIRKLVTKGSRGQLLYRIYRDLADQLDPLDEQGVRWLAQRQGWTQAEQDTLTAL